MASGARSTRDDSGAALVEFIGLSVILLIPVVYLIVTLSLVQAAGFAAESAARDAARAAVVVGVGNRDSGQSHSAAASRAHDAAHRAVALVLEDFGIDAREDGDLTVTCTSNPCFDPGSAVTARVEVTVSLPGVPGWLTAIAPLTITVSADARSPVDGLLS